MEWDGKMKIGIKRKIIVFLVLIFVMSLNSISFGIKMDNPFKIDTRGLTFNTGTSSDQIRVLKDFFRAKNEPNVPWGYAYDDRTKELVKNYQELMGLQADGIAGKTTIDRINREITEENLKIGIRTIATDVKGDMIVINKSSNTLYFLKDGLVQESYPVATGKTTQLTPDGRFKVVVKYKNPGWGGAGVSDPIPGGAPNNPLGTRWIGISYGGGGKYGIHGNSNPRSIGTYASLGCVRMFNEDVEKLYENIKIQTPVWIGPEDLLINYGVKFSYKERKLAEKSVIEQKEISLVLDGEKLELEDKVINKNGTTYYPFREIVEFVSGEVVWDNENKIAKGILGVNYVEFQLNNNEYKNNDKYRFLPEGQVAFINKGKMYLPIRYFMEGLGYEVNWDEETRAVLVDTVIIDPID